MSSRIAAIAACFALVASAAEGRADEEALMDAATIVSLVQAFYDQTTTLQAMFDQTRYTQLYDRYDRAQGKVAFKKPGKMRWDYAEPNGQVFVSDGKKLLIYQPPEEGEKRGQLIERALEEDQLPSAFSFLTGRGKLDEDFDARLIEHDDQNYQDGYVLQLIPRRPTPHYEQLVFYVRTLERNGKRAGIVQRVLIIDSAGNRNRFDFSDLKFNREISDKRFNYQPPRGTDRVTP
jgi:outer membrane lipoprotein carrier protein